MTLRNLNIAPRSALGFGLMALLVFVLGGFTLVQMSKLSEQSDVVSDEWIPSVLAINEVSQSFLRLRALNLRILLMRDDQTLQANVARIDELKTSMKKALRAYEELMDPPEKAPEDFAIYQRLITAENAYLREQEKIMELSRQGQLDAALAVVKGELNQRADDMSNALAELVKLNSDGAFKQADISAAMFQSSRIWIIVAMLLAGLVTVVLAWLLTRSIVAPLARAVAVAETVATGDLTENIQVEGTDEPARLLAALKTMQQNLRSAIHNIADSSSQLASASEELSAVTEDSTRGLHQQNDEIEQAATAVNEMTTAVEEVARNAVITSEASQASDRTTQHGREQVRHTVDSITGLANDVTVTAGEVEHLASKVRDISKVLDVIRSIADQTNLLALNAAIEAARAGDAGRGFAVVADEVRALAHRTQQSTQEIEQMVGGIQQGTDQAVSSMQRSNTLARSTLDVAEAAGRALDEIAVAIAEINERNMVIASASEEQAQVAREVDRNLMNIRDLSLQSSAGANQTSAASQELSRLAVDLNGIVARFKV
ncbi:methyl-accepting chemotaxis protein [Pseudomonas sp. ok272]|uniref:methyl-accepting chemotaxis protein n=1 Tax=unclassified Pseudomonas TaxID=196821 RepID=UPI0008CCB8C9|nr:MULTISPECIES: methyl-accepting chemotaxis protein [unclassified Pseudomonas]SEM47022.1 methyl-accepting chemotaxis protein [Pseudomonas sp. ok272]SFM18611.1 methyl-accepting chemotaxis protein [Pseudomonas sp. ok602]